MSSVSGSGSDVNQREINQRNRDEYNTKESEQQKQHKKEIQNLNRAHAKEINDLRKNYENVIQGLQKQARTDLSDKDKSYQGEISKMREASLSQMRKNAADNEAKRDQLRDATRQEIEAQKSTADLRENELRSNFETEIRQKDTEFKDYAERSREMAEKSYQHQAEQLNSAHAKESELGRQERTQKVAQMQKDYEALSKNKETEIKDINRKSSSEKERMESTFMGTIQDERKATNQVLDMQRKGFRDDLHQVQDQFKKAHEKEADAIHDSNEQFKDSVNDRLNHETLGLKRQIAELKQTNVSKEIANKQQFETERRHLQDDYANSAEEYHKAVESANHENLDRMHKDVVKMNQANEKLIMETHRGYQDQMTQNKMKNDEYMGQLKEQWAADKDHAEKFTDRRIKNLTLNSEREKAEIATMANQEVEQTRQDTQDRIRDVQMKDQKDRDDIETRMSASIRKQEGESNEKMANLAAQYEAQIVQMRDQHQVEMRRAHKATDLRLTQQAKATDLALQTQEVQHDRKLKLMQERHEAELKDLSRRYQAQIDGMVQHLKQTNQG